MPHLETPGFRFEAECQITVALHCCQSCSNDYCLALVVQCGSGPVRLLLVRLERNRRWWCNCGCHSQRPSYHCDCCNVTIADDQLEMIAGLHLKTQKRVTLLTKALCDYNKVSKLSRGLGSRSRWTIWFSAQGSTKLQVFVLTESRASAERHWPRQMLSMLCWAGLFKQVHEWMLLSFFVSCLFHLSDVLLACCFDQTFQIACFMSFALLHHRVQFKQPHVLPETVALFATQLLCRHFCRGQALRKDCRLRSLDLRVVCLMGKQASWHYGWCMFIKEVVGSNAWYQSVSWWQYRLEGSSQSLYVLLQAC